MQIELIDIGKRFRYEWIFKGIHQSFIPSEKYVLLGPNGSGKSTLMKVLSGHLSPSKGNISFLENNKKCDIDTVYKQISYAAPYIDLIEEMTLNEVIDYYFHFKPLRKGLNINDLIHILDFKKSTHKPIRFFSSGMKQRLKLILAICADTPLLLLDEPTTNLDAQGVAWYQALINQYVLKNDSNTEGGNRLVIVASNIEHDYTFCTQKLNILDYKD